MTYIKSTIISPFPQTYISVEAPPGGLLHLLVLQNVMFMSCFYIRSVGRQRKCILQMCKNMRRHKSAEMFLFDVMTL